MILTRDKGSRMWGGGGTGGSGGGGGLDPSALAGYASMGWVEDNYVSKAFFNQLFEYQYNHRVLTKDGETVVSDVTTAMVAAPNEVVDTTSHTETDDETGYTIITTNTITGIKAKAGLWTNQYMSALGQNSGGGGGGGTTTLADLLDVALSNPSNGQVLMYNATTQKWYNGTVQSSGGSVTSITAGTGLSGGTITISGTIALSSETQTNIGYGVVAYGWGNHADAGYLTSSAISDMATQTWVTNNFLGINATAAAATKLATAREFWGQSFDGTAAVTGTLSYVGDINSNALGSINNFNKIELNATANDGNGGAIYFHYNGMSGRASGYIINDADGLVSVLTPTGNIGLKVGTQTNDYIQIGDIRIVYDNTDNRNSLKVVKSDGTAANFYATGAVSALGSNNSGGGGGGGASTLADLTDVILTNPAGGDLLQFNGTHWVNLTVATVMSGYAKLRYPNDLVHSGNEITMVPSGFSGDLYFNYQTVGGANGAITNYNFCNGNHAYAAVKASGFVKNGSDDSYVLLGGGGHALISSLSVGNADTVDGYHADHFLNRLDWWGESDSHDVDTLTSGIVFAYSTHNAPTTGTIATFSGTNDTYQFQIMCGYHTDAIYFRGKNGDNNTWQAWRSFIHSGNIGSQSVNYATSAGSANYATSAGSAPASDVYSWAKQPNKPSYSFSELTSTPTTLVGYGITDAYISSGTIYLGSNSITPVTSLAGYATETWVQQRGYLTSVAFSDLTSHPTTIAGYGITDAKFGTVGADYVPITLGSTTKNVLTAHQSLSAYATQTWVTNNFLGINATAAAATKLATPRELWGQSFDGTAAVTGTLSYVGDINSNTNGNINNFNGIEMSYKASSGHGGGIFFHWDGVTGYSSAYIFHDADNHINMYGHTAGFGVQVGSQNGDYLQIGAVRLVYDNTNNALKVVGSDGSSAANFYATGAISALGANTSGGGGTGISYKSTGNITLASNTWYRIASLAGTSNVGTSSFRIYSVSGNRTFSSKVILSLRGSSADLIKEGSCNKVIGDLRITTDDTNTYLEVKTGYYGSGIVIKADTYEDYSDLDNSLYGWVMYQSAVIGSGTEICTTSDDGRTLTFSGSVYCTGEFNSGEYYCSGNIYSEGDISTEKDIWAAGDAHASSFINSSDARLKDIQDYDAIIDVNTLANAPAIHFTWKEKPDTRAHVGTIAQYWQDVVPEVVTESKDGYLSMQYDVLAMLSAISVAKKVVDHETRIAELEKENELLRNKIDKLKN